MSDKKGSESKSSPDVKVGWSYEYSNPLNVFDVPDGKSVKWCDKKKMEERKYEGWVPVEPGTLTHINPDGQNCDGGVTYRDLVLCQMPKERVEERNAFYRNKGAMALEGYKQEYKDAIIKNGGIPNVEYSEKRERKYY